MNAESESRQIREISQRLFRDKGAAGHFVEDENQLGSAAASYYKPDVTLSPKAPEIGFVHRQLSGGDLYFLANTSNRPLSVLANFRHARKYAEWWDPFTGHVLPVENPAKIEISFQPYESRLIFFTNSVIKPEPSRILGTHSKDIDLTTDWKLTFGDSNQTIHMATLHSWSEEQPFKYYSGQVSYEKTIDLPDDLTSKTSLILDFGEGTPVALPERLPTFNLRAYLEGPVREAAEVFVNGQRAGVVWHPPYTLDVSAFLNPGKNELRIVVGNTAINSMAGRALPDYRLLNDRYGERFIPQGMDNLQPLESGLAGGLRLRVIQRH
jgi:hypothetical protein